MVCTRCKRRPALESGLLCRACELELKARPKVTTYDRQPPEAQLDFWRIAQDLLYPDLSYRALDKAMRVRVTQLARAMANIPYKEPPPPMDDEARMLLTAHLLVGRRMENPGDVDHEALPLEEDDDDDELDDD